MGDKHDVCRSYGTLHAATCTCAVKGGSSENQSRGNSTCTEICKRNTVSFTQCVHMHRSVRVTVRTCSHILL